MTSNHSPSSENKRRGFFQLGKTDEMSKQIHAKVHMTHVIHNEGKNGKNLHVYRFAND